MQKHRKWTSRLPLGLPFNCSSWIFYMLYYNSRALLRYNNSSKIPCTKPWFFPLKFPKISFLMKVLKIGIFGWFLTEKKKCIILQYFYQIALQLECLTYLPKIDELASLDRLSSRGLWKWYNSKGFAPATIWRGAAFHFLAVYSKIKILWKLWLWFSKMFH